MTNTDKRAGWERVPGTVDIDNGKGKIYRGLVRFERPCANCGQLFAIHVTSNVADGSGHNTGFGLRNCEKHRMRMTAPGGANSEELEKLRMANKVMKEELDPLYVRVKDLHAELETTKARLATYELAPAMAQQQRVTAWTSDPTMKAPDPEGDKLLKEFLAKKNKLPWEG